MKGDERLKSGKRVYGSPDARKMALPISRLLSEHIPFSHLYAFVPTSERKEILKGSPRTHPHMRRRSPDASRTDRAGRDRAAKPPKRLAGRQVGGVRYPSSRYPLDRAQRSPGGRLSWTGRDGLAS